MTKYNKETFVNEELITKKMKLGEFDISNLHLGTVRRVTAKPYWSESSENPDGRLTRVFSQIYSNFGSPQEELIGHVSLTQKVTGEEICETRSMLSIGYDGSQVVNAQYDGKRLLASSQGLDISANELVRNFVDPLLQLKPHSAGLTYLARAGNTQND